MDKNATTSAPIHELLANRWSPRSFDPAVNVTKEQMQSLAEAARWAPSCFGAEPWSYIFCNKADDEEVWNKALSCLAEGNQAWVKNVPLIIFAIGQQNFTHNNKPNAHHLYDTGAASISLVLQAETLGLRGHQMGGFDPAKVVESFNVPDGWTAIATIAVGKQAPAENLTDDKMKEMEEAPRERQELGSKFFNGEWGKTL